MRKCVYNARFECDDFLNPCENCFTCDFNTDRWGEDEDDSYEFVDDDFALDEDDFVFGANTPEREGCMRNRYDSFQECFDDAFQRGKKFGVKLNIDSDVLDKISEIYDLVNDCFSDYDFNIIRFNKLIEELTDLYVVSQKNHYFYNL